MAPSASYSTCVARYIRLYKFHSYVRITFFLYFSIKAVFEYFRPPLHETVTKSNRHEYRNLHHVYMRPKRKHSGAKTFGAISFPVVIDFIVDIYMTPGRKLLRPVWSHLDWADNVQTGMKFIWVYIHPALISSRFEHSRPSLEGGMTSDRSEQFSFRSHVNIYYKNYHDRNEIAPVWLRTGPM